MLTNLKVVTDWKKEGCQIRIWVLKPIVSYLIAEKLTKTPCGTAECWDMLNSHAANWLSEGKFPYTKMTKIELTNTKNIYVVHKLKPGFINKDPTSMHLRWYKIKISANHQWKEKPTNLS